MGCVPNLLSETKSLKKTYLSTQVQILHNIQLYILILSCSLCSETFELSVFHFHVCQFLEYYKIILGVIFGFFAKKLLFFHRECRF